MAFVFLDESGDLGFDFSKEKTSKFFVISVLFAEDKSPLHKIVKKVHSHQARKFKRKSGVLHAYRSQPSVRSKLLSAVNGCDCQIMAIYLTKEKVYTDLRKEKHLLYNYVTNILLERICTKKLIPIDKQVVLIASKRETNRFLNDNFKDYLKTQSKNKHKLDLEIELKTPAEEKALQATDFVSWAIFRKIEHQDDSYYNLIRSSIAEENPIFK